MLGHMYNNMVVLSKKWDKHENVAQTMCILYI